MIYQSVQILAGCKDINLCLSNQYKMKPVFISLIFLCTAFCAVAQKHSQTKDVIVMKNGDRLTGEITHYAQGEKVILKRADGTELTIIEEEIEQIIQEVQDDSPNVFERESYVPEPKIYIEPTVKGLYSITQLSFAMGSGNEDGLALGAGISTIVGFQIKPLVGIGVGAGLDNYARRGETIYPIFLDLRAYLPISKKPYHYYVVLNGGYGFAFARENIGINEATGGYLMQGAVGYRTTTREGVDVNIDAGVKFQEAGFSRDLFNGDIEVRELVFKRFTVRVGIALWGKK